MAERTHERDRLRTAGQAAARGRSAGQRVAVRQRGDGQDAGAVGACAAAAARTGCRSFAGVVPDLHQGGRGRNGGAGQRGARAVGADGRCPARQGARLSWRAGRSRHARPGPRTVRTRARLPRRRLADRYDPRICAISPRRVPGRSGHAARIAPDGRSRARPAQPRGAGDAAGRRRHPHNRRDCRTEQAQGPRCGPRLADALRTAHGTMARTGKLAAADAAARPPPSRHSCRCRCCMGGASLFGRRLSRRGLTRLPVRHARMARQVRAALRRLHRGLARR